MWKNKNNITLNYVKTPIFIPNHCFPCLNLISMYFWRLIIKYFINIVKLSKTSVKVLINIITKQDNIILYNLCVVTGTEKTESNKLWAIRSLNWCYFQINCWKNILSIIYGSIFLPICTFFFYKLSQHAR